MLSSRMLDAPALYASPRICIWISFSRITETVASTRQAIQQVQRALIYQRVISYLCMTIYLIRKSKKTKKEQIVRRIRPSRYKRGGTKNLRHIIAMQDRGERVIK